MIFHDEGIPLIMCAQPNRIIFEKIDDTLEDILVRHPSTETNVKNVITYFYFFPNQNIS